MNMQEDKSIIEVSHVSKYFGDKTALDDVTLNVKKGEFVTILGPSGCGKTTLLRLIAGFQTASEGEIRISGMEITQTPPHKRPVNTVFQKYALFPHLNVYDNIAFGLKLKKTPKQTIEKKVKAALKMVGMTDYEYRDVDSLSGGQQQRVAIARAIVNEPEVLLLDEPLAALDLKMRKDMQMELKEMHKSLGITFVYVTHDQEEALTLSDTIVVMSEGKIQQIGTPIDIYNEPINAFVADFIGESNILNGTMIHDKLVRFCGTEFECVDEGFGENVPVDVVIRPEDLYIFPVSDMAQLVGVVVSGRYGFAYLASDIEMANSMEYMNTMQAAIDNYNVQMGANLQLYVPSQIQETNWVKEISRKNSKTGTGSISISGGNEKTTFFASLGANTQEGYLNKSSYDQYNMRAKFTHKINNLFKLNMNLAGSASRSDLLEETSTSLKVLRTAREEQPWYSPYKEDGTSYKVNGTDILRHNPVMLINEEDWVAKKYQLSGVFSVDVTPFKGFKYTPTVSVYGILDNTSKKLSDKHDARKNSSGWGALAEQKDQSFRYVIDNIFSYNNEWNKLIYSVMLGHSFEKYTYEQFGAKSDNYANGAFPSSNFDLINAGPNIYAGNISYTSYALESYFGRIALNWDNKYILNASLRSDGSSRFAKNKRYGYFPSASFAWRASNEEFFPKNKYVNDAKLRLSWGMTGSMAGVSNYAPLSLISAGGASYNGSAGFQISQDARALTWEKASQFNIGFDIEMFQSRLTLNIDMFYQKTTDLLFKKPVNATTGYTTLQSNIGSLENKGLELALNGKIFTGKFKWDLGGNISFVKNKLLSLIEGNDMYIVPSSGSNLLGGSMHALINGQPISTFYMLKMEGIYQRDDEVPAKLYAKGVRAGDVKYFDYNEDGDISDADRMNVGKAIPDFYGGITSNFSYKGFDLSLFGQFSVGGKVMSAWRGVNGSEGTDHLGLALSNVKVNDRGESVEQYFNVSKEVANGYWRGEGTSNTIPRPVRIGVHTGYDYDYNVQTSTRYLEDASYFKLKTVTLGYTLPESVVKKLRVNSLRVYVSADNLLTLTKYSGYDPETSFSGSPGDSNYGVDFGLQPVLRTFIFGLNLNF